MKKVFLKCEKFIIGKLGNKVSIAIDENIKSMWHEHLQSRDAYTYYNVFIQCSITHDVLFNFRCDKLEDIYVALQFHYMQYINQHGNPNLG